MEEIYKIISIVIGAAGGTGALILTLFNFTANKVAKRLESKYELRLNKELEQYKSKLQKDVDKLNYKLENSNHISKVLFDVKIELYRKLSEAFYQVILCSNSLIPVGIEMTSTDRKEEENIKSEQYKNLSDAVLNAQNLLYSSIPFITSEQYESYQTILNMSREHLFDFSRRWCITDFSESKKTLQPEAYERTRNIIDSFKTLSKEINSYLSSLVIIKD